MKYDKMDFFYVRKVYPTVALNSLKKYFSKAFSW